MHRHLRTDLSRRGLIGMGAAAATALALPAWAQGGAAGIQPWLEEKVYGDPNAPVTVIEYASLSCSACAAFHREVFPVLKKEFIDPGQVKLVFRDFPLNAPGLKAHALARCAGESRFAGLADVLFKTQSTWLNDSYLENLRKIGAMAGITPAQFDACMNDKALENFLVQSQLTGGREHNVSSTPTFVVEETGAVIVGVDQEGLFRALTAAGATRAAS